MNNRFLLVISEFDSDAVEFFDEYLKATDKFHTLLTLCFERFRDYYINCDDPEYLSICATLITIFDQEHVKVDKSFRNNSLLAADKPSLRIGHAARTILLTFLFSPNPELPLTNTNRMQLVRYAPKPA